jgi:hypothetical protein
MRSGLLVDFIENRGQWHGSARFVARQERLTTLLAPRAITLRLSAERPADVSLTFDGASSDAIMTGEEKRSGRYNFFLGSDPRQWHSNVPAFGAVRYRGLYQGVDLRVHQRTGRLEYDLLVAPGADVDQVLIRTEGTSGIQIGPDGTLILETAAGPLRQSAPTTWEELPDGTTRPLESRFRRIDAKRYGFEVSGRDENLPLVIDPGLEWSTFVGGWNREEIHGLALARDGSGDVVVAGSTWSSDFPTAPAGSLGSSPLVSFVARLNSSGTDLVYATLFGGTHGNVSYGYGLTLDASSAPVVVGETNAADFPTTPGAYQRTFNEPATDINRGWDAYVTRFDASGSQMIFSTFVGAAPIFDPANPLSAGGDESARAVVLDASDSVIVTGYTTSANFPTTAGAFDRTLSRLSVPVSGGTIESRMDAFVARLNPNGTQLTYSTYLGGQSDDVVKAMVIDPQGTLTLVGTESPLETFDAQNNRTDHGIPFPTTPDAIARTHLGASDVFVARLRLDGTGSGDLAYATILGGFYIDEATSLTSDPNDPERVTLGGDSRSWDFPTTPGVWKRSPVFLWGGAPYYFGFLTQFRFAAAGGNSIVWSGLVEGGGAQIPSSVVVDGSGDLIVVGADEGGLPTTERSYKRVPSTGIFVSRFSGDGRDLRYSTFLHKSSGVMADLLARKLAVSSGPHQVIVAGGTLFPDFPTTPGAFDRIFGSDGTSDNFHRYDGFVAKVTTDPNTSSDTTAAAPTLLSPADGVNIPVNGTLTLDWSDVTDPSGVQGYEVAVNDTPDLILSAPLAGFPPGAGFFTTSQSSTMATQNYEKTWYWRVRTLDGANNFSPWSPVRKFTVGNVNWTNFGGSTLTPDGLVGGNTAQGKVYILNSAPAGGQVYTLTSNNPSVASVPPSVTVPAGANSATFTVTTNSVAVSTPVMITVWADGNGGDLVLWVDPAASGSPTLASLTVNPSSLTGGATSQGTATLSAAAPAGGQTVTLSSSNSAIASVPASVTVGAGATSATFTVATTSVPSSAVVTVTGTSGGTTRTADLTVTPSGGGAPGFLSPTANAADSSGDGNGFESSASSAQADDAAFASDINSGTGTGTSCTSTGKDRHRFYNYGIAIPGGSSITGIEVRLDARADSTSSSPRMCVQLSWDGGTTWTTAKATATLGTSMATFTLGSPTDTWGRTWSATNLANANFRVRVINVSSSTSRDFFLDWVAVRVNTGAAAPAGLSAVSVSPTSVTGGSPSTGTVTLTAAAPAGGAVVSLSSSNTNAATVPASVSVAAGATSASFTVTTTSVSASTSVTLSAAYSGVTKTATLTVNAQATGDTVAIQRAEYDDRDEELIVEATSTSASATLQVFVTSTNQLIGTLTNNGGGRYSRTFSNVSNNPQNVTVRSSLGGSASRAVTTGR